MLHLQVPRCPGGYTVSPGGFLSSRRRLTTASDQGTFSGSYVGGTLTLSLSVGQGCTGSYTLTGRALRDVFKRVDLIALPTLQTLPPRMPPSLKVDLLKAKAQVSALENTDPLFLALHPVEAITSIPATGLRLLGIDLLEANMLKIQNTVAVNFAGNPAVAVPIPLRRGGTPVTSLQLIGPRYSEADLLSAARFVESES